MGEYGSAAAGSVFGAAIKRAVKRGAKLIVADPRRIELAELLLDVWYSVPKDKRWSVMEYDIKGGKFEVVYDTRK